MCVAWLTFVLPCMCCQNPEQGEYWPEEPDYNDEYMYHTARRDHTRVFHQKKQYPQNILFKVDYRLVHLLVTFTYLWLLHLMGFGSLYFYVLYSSYNTTVLYDTIKHFTILQTLPNRIIIFTPGLIHRSQTIFRHHPSF